MLLSTLIERKRDGGTLEPDELEALLDAYMSGDLADYQMSAFLMAVFFRGLTRTELAGLTRAIIESGTRLELGEVGGPAVDKHSTGGVGDKVSLVLAPLLAEAGLRVPMVSGRGLGHTGGTLDKLESIPGFDVHLDLARFRSVLDDVGCAMIGQGPEIAPLDGRLYALRDVTGTVPAISLIASSIVSKKVAEGISSLVLDVKFGDGAVLTDPTDARVLARLMVDLAGAEGLRASALLTAMDAPLGLTVGNALEVREAIECLAGGGPDDLRELTLELSAELLPPELTRADLAGLLDDGTALARFGRLIECQGGDPAVLDDPDLLPQAPVRRTLVASESGVVHAVAARTVGLAAVELGAGRRRADDDVDPAVGFELHVVPGGTVEVGQPTVTIHARTEDGAERAAARFASALAIGPADTAPAPAPLVRERVEPRPR
ncbi:MAG: thymidine phosphorylase [Gemmatimonadota bacterium]